MGSSGAGRRGNSRTPGVDLQPARPPGPSTGRPHILGARGSAQPGPGRESSRAGLRLPPLAQQPAQPAQRRENSVVNRLRNAQQMAAQLQGTEVDASRLREEIGAPLLGEISFAERFPKADEKGKEFLDNAMEQVPELKAELGTILGSDVLKKVAARIMGFGIGNANNSEYKVFDDLRTNVTEAKTNFGPKSMEKLVATLESNGVHNIKVAQVNLGTNPPDHKEFGIILEDFQRSDKDKLAILIRNGDDKGGHWVEMNIMKDNDGKFLCRYQDSTGIPIEDHPTFRNLIPKIDEKLGTVGYELASTFSGIQKNSHGCGFYALTTALNNLYKPIDVFKQELGNLKQYKSIVAEAKKALADDVFEFCQKIGKEGGVSIEDKSKLVSDIMRKLIINSPKPEGTNPEPGAFGKKLIGDGATNFAKKEITVWVVPAASAKIKPMSTAEKVDILKSMVEYTKHLTREDMLTKEMYAAENKSRGDKQINPFRISNAAIDTRDSIVQALENKLEVTDIDEKLTTMMELTMKYFMHTEYESIRDSIVEYAYGITKDSEGKINVAAERPDTPRHRTAADMRAMVSSAQIDSKGHFAELPPTDQKHQGGWLSQRVNQKQKEDVGSKGGNEKGK